MASAEQQQQPVPASTVSQAHEHDSGRAEQSDRASADAYESTHVHAVYEQIAPHFSSTRHKPWPLVATFLEGQKPGAVGIDVGCGNGKYLPVNPSLHILGSDRSANLVKLARTERSGEVAVADGLDLPYAPDRFDFAISIAVIHHLSTPERRQESIAEILARLRPEDDAHALIFVWALEQASSRRGWGEGSAQDTLVPWVMRSKGKPDETFQRYYHLYREGEIEQDVLAAGGVVLQSGYERDNWWVICKRQQVGAT